MPDNSLYSQCATIALSHTKVRLSLLATAMVDALGAPVEFNPRFSFSRIDTMIPNDNFSLPPGVWTDDTSMTLCLARSLATSPDGFDEHHQLDAYVSWWKHGVLSPTGHCFDIGNTIHRALSIYSSPSPVAPQKRLERIQEKLGGENFAGNGSLMRVLPVGLAYWRNELAARAYGRRSSATTHPNPLCMDACELWTGCISLIMQATASDSETAVQRLTKLDLLNYISSFPYKHETLRGSLAFPLMPENTSAEEAEAYYSTQHPLLRRISSDEELPLQKDLPSTGYVLHTLIAALYCFFATVTFEQGAIMAVNLGDDADTVGAVYASLAGCWYSSEDKGSNGLFWSPKVREWRNMLVKRDLVEEVADELVQFQAELGSRADRR